MAVIREMTPADLPAVIEIEKSCFSKEAWREEDFAYRIGRQGFINLCAEEGGKIIGYITVSDYFDAAIDSIAVDVNYRRAGIGRSLIEKALGECSSDRVYLEVRVSNAAARGLYKSLGFSETGIRKNYYSEPDEDAVTMVKDLIL